MTIVQTIARRLNATTPTLVRVPSASLNDGRPLDAGTVQCLANNAAHLGRENSRRLLFSALNPLPSVGQLAANGGLGVYDDSVAQIAGTWLNNPPASRNSWTIGGNAIATEYAPCCDAYNPDAPADMSRRAVKIILRAKKTSAMDTVYAAAAITDTWSRPSLAGIATSQVTITSTVEATYEMTVQSLFAAVPAEWGSPRVSSADNAIWPRSVLWVSFTSLDGGGGGGMEVKSIIAYELRDPAGGP